MGLALASGCIGEVSGAGGASPGPLDPGRDDTPPELQNGQFQCAEPSRGLQSDLRRLSSTELRNSLRVLFGDQIMSQVASALGGFPSDGQLSDSNPFQNIYAFDRAKAGVDLASDIADAVVDSIETRSAVFGDCVTESPVSDDCVRTFVSEFGSRVFRRPLNDEEIATHTSFFEAASSGDDGLKTTLMGLLMSPNFLYHVETGTEGGDAGQVRLTDFEVASRIAYRTTEAPPDAGLLQAAADGRLSTVAEVRAEVVRLLATPAGERRLQDFFAYWFEVDQRPGFENTSDAFRNGFDVDGLEQEAREELFSFLDYSLFQNRSGFADLITSKDFFPQSERLADLYGTAVWSAGAAPVQTDQPRSGVLGRTVMLASGHDESDPILRGVFLRTRVLCDTLNPPDEVALSQRNDQVILDPATHTKRERVAEFTSPDECMACHSMINELAFSLEQFDGLGRYRETETVYDSDGAVLAMHPINSASQPAIEAITDDRVVDSLDGMAQIVSESPKATACMTRHWFRFSQYRRERVADGCQLREMHDALTRGDSLLDAFVLGIAQESIFYRSLEDM